MNLYLILGVRREANGRRHQAGVQAAGAEVPPGHQPGRPRGRPALSRDRRGLRRADRPRSPPCLRRRAGGRSRSARRRTSSRGSTSPVEADRGRAATFTELFGDALARSRRAWPRSGGPTCTRTSSLAFEEPIRGTRRSLTLTRLERCGPCQGRGALTGPPGPCPACEGQGVVRGGRGHMVFSTDVPRLRRRGRRAAPRVRRPAAARASACAPTRSRSNCPPGWPTAAW